MKLLILSTKRSRFPPHWLRRQRLSVVSISVPELSLTSRLLQDHNACCTFLCLFYPPSPSHSLLHPKLPPAHWLPSLLLILLITLLFSVCWLSPHHCLFHPPLSLFFPLSLSPLSLLSSPPPPLSLSLLTAPASPVARSSLLAMLNLLLPLSARNSSSCLWVFSFPHLQ